MKKKNKQKNFLYPIFFISLLLIAFSFRGSVKIAKMDSTDNVAGYAWSSNIGWISFNCINTGTCGTSDYGVNLEPSTMNLSGYAWSDLGWISFNPTASIPPSYSHNFSSHCQNAGADCISSTDCISCFNPDDMSIYGWAHILSLGDDGWINLNCDNDDTCGTSDYHLDVWANLEFYGWGYNGSNTASTSIGWISFSCDDIGTCGTSDYKVHFMNIHFPEVNSLEAPNWDSDYACSSGARGAFLSWDFYDEDGDSQKYYQVIVNNVNDKLSPIIDTGKVLSNAEQYFIPSDGTLDYDTPYYWWVRVWDDFGFASNWTHFDTNVNTASSTHVLTDNIARNNSISPEPNRTFTLYRHEFPDVDFTFVPAELLKGEVATFTDASFYYTNASPSTPITCDDSHCNYLWHGGGIDTISATTSKTTEMTFKYSLDPSVSTTSVSLIITDNDSYSCSTTKHMFVDLLPDWKEIKAE